jgi:hypothetical protein
MKNNQSTYYEIHCPQLPAEITIESLRLAKKLTQAFEGGNHTYRLFRFYVISARKGHWNLNGSPVAGYENRLFDNFEDVERETIFLNPHHENGFDLGMGYFFMAKSYIPPVEEKKKKITFESELDAILRKKVLNCIENVRDKMRDEIVDLHERYMDDVY